MLLSLGLLLGATTLAAITYLRSPFCPICCQVRKAVFKEPVLQEELWPAGEVWGAGADPHQLLLWQQALEAQ